MVRPGCGHRQNGRDKSEDKASLMHGPAPLDDRGKPRDSHNVAYMRRRKQLSDLHVADQQPKRRTRSFMPYSDPVCLCGASTGFDSGEPRWRRKMLNTTITPMARNSLCQF